MSKTFVQIPIDNTTDEAVKKLQINLARPRLS
jgi:hypothetical protein